ncbi:unnamed protein product, partial [Discosporangium mesarthrocarpum]
PRDGTPIVGSTNTASASNGEASLQSTVVGCGRAGSTEAVMAATAEVGAGGASAGTGVGMRVGEGDTNRPMGLDGDDSGGDDNSDGDDVVNTKEACPPGYTQGTWLWEWRVLSCRSWMSIGVCGHGVAADPEKVEPAPRGEARAVSAGGSRDGSGSPGAGGERATGMRSTRGSSRDAVGDHSDLWAYRSDGHMVQAGVKSDVMCPGGGYESGDVVGVEVDVGVGSVAFLKNGAYVGEALQGVGSSAAAKLRGVLPCISVGGGEGALLLGLKEGEGSLTYLP